MANCSIEGCERVARARGWCTKHYKLWLRHGSPDWRRPSPVERFWSRFKREPNGCWEWQGALNSDGYGVIRVAESREMRAHRFAFELLVEPIPEGLMVRHHCDNPRCVNPSHLEVGTAADNAADCVTRDRVPRGEAKPRALLTNADVVQIRERLAQGEGASTLGREYGVSHSSIRCIRDGRTWTHVPAHN